MSTMDTVLSQVDSFSREQLLSTVKRIYQTFTSGRALDRLETADLSDSYEVCWETVPLEQYLSRCSRLTDEQAPLLVWSRDEGFLAMTRAAALSQDGTVELGRQMSELLSALAGQVASRELDVIIDLPSLMPDSMAMQGTPTAMLDSLVDVFAELRALLRDAGSRSINLLLRTTDTLHIEGDDPVATLPVQAVFHGLAKCIALECPRVRVTVVDVVTGAEVHPLMALARGPERQLRCSSQAVAYPLLRRAQARELVDVAAHRWGNCLVVGGRGAAGQQLVQALLKEGATGVWSTGRGKVGPAAEDTRIEYLSLEVTDFSAVQALEERLRVQGVQIDTVFHLAGVLREGLFLDAGRESDKEVLAPKLLGAINLLQAFDVVHTTHYFFSSIVSLIGTHGASSYCAANAFLDQLARRQGVRLCAINWGPLEDLGMARVSGMNTAQAWQRVGITPGPFSAAARQLPWIARCRTGQWVHADVDWRVLHEQLGDRLSAAFLGQVMPAPGMAAAQPQILPIRARILALADGNAATAALQDYLMCLFRTFTAVEPGLLTTECNIESWGLDSLVLMDILKTVRADLGLMIYPRELYTHSTLAQFAAYLSGQLALDPLAHTSPSPEPQVYTEYLSPLVNRSAPLQQAADAVAEGVAFILSSPRSGSTLLRAMLQGHGQVFAPPELHLLGYDSIGAWREAARASYFDQGLQRALMELHGATAEAAAARIDAWVQEGKSVKDVYRLLRESSQCSLLIDKSPSYASSVEALLNAERNFIKPRYIHLVRHPLAMIESFNRMRMHKLLGHEENDGLMTAEQIWLSGNLNVEAFFDNHVDPDRVLRVSYESLVKDTETTLRSICEFLGIAFAPAMLTPYAGARMNDGVHAGSMAIEDPNFNSRESVDESLADAWQQVKLDRELLPQTQRLAAALGYQLPAKAACDSGPQRREGFIQAGEIALCFSDWGVSDNPDFILLHGLLDQAPVWDDVARLLHGQGLACVAPDIRGHGLSGHGPIRQLPSLLDYITDLDALHQQCGGQPLNLVAHSFGSVIAVAYASAFPERVKHLLLIEPVLLAEKRYTPQQHYREMMQFLSAPHVHHPIGTLEDAAARIRSVSPFLDLHKALELAARITADGVDGGKRWTWDPRLRFRAGLGLGIDRAAYLEILHSLSVDVHVVFGQESRSNRRKDIELLTQGLAPDHVSVIEGGHNLHLQYPEAIASFLCARTIPGAGKGENA